MFSVVSLSSSTKMVFVPSPLFFFLFTVILVPLFSLVFAFHCELMELVPELMCMFIRVCMFVSKTLYSLYSKCVRICLTICGFEPNRKSKSATMPALHSPVEVQSGVTHGE